MTIYVPNVRIVASVGNDGLPEELRPAARARADRKIMRFLDGGSLAPFVAMSMVIEQAGLTDLSELAVFTVSGWDPRVPDIPSGLDDEGVARTFYEPSNPSDWLRRLPNSPLCQTSIVHEYRGANMHLIGDAGSLELAFNMAVGMLRDDAPFAVVCAFDPVPGQAHFTPDDVTNEAAAVLITKGSATDGVEVDVTPGRRAVDALDDVVSKKAVTS